MTSSSKDSSRSVVNGLVAVGAVFLLLIAFIAFQSWQKTRAAEEDIYNGFPFTKASDNIWVTRIEVGGQPYNVPFYYHPREVEDILLDAAATRYLLEQRPDQVIISLHPDAGSQVVIAGVEISRITGSRYNLLNIPTSSALSAPSNTTIEIPIVTCEDATETTTVIQFIHADKNAIVAEGHCVMVLYMSPEESVRVADRLAYRLLRIMY